MYESKNILIVDDSRAMRSLNKISLKGIGYNNVLDAEDGLDALDKLDQNPIDLILMDWAMPKMDGLECLKEIKKSEKYSDIPVIMVTTMAGSHKIYEAISAGAAAYILKPVDDIELEQKMFSAFEGV